MTQIKEIAIFYSILYFSLSLLSSTFSDSLTFYFPRRLSISKIYFCHPRGNQTTNGKRTNGKFPFHCSNKWKVFFSLLFRLRKLTLCAILLFHPIFRQSREIFENHSWVKIIEKNYIQCADVFRFDIFGSSWRGPEERV